MSGLHRMRNGFKKSEWRISDFEYYFSHLIHFFPFEFHNLLLPEIPLGSNANINELLSFCIIDKNCLPPPTPACFCYSIPTYKKTETYDLPSDYLWH